MNVSAGFWVGMGAGLAVGAVAGMMLPCGRCCILHGFPGENDAEDETGSKETEKCPLVSSDGSPAVNQDVVLRRRQTRGTGGAVCWAGS